MAKPARKSAEAGRNPAGRPQTPEKCRKCAMLTMPQVHALHGAEGTSERCYDPSVCRSRRSHARKSEQNNYNRRIQHKQKKRQSQPSNFATVLLGDALAAPETPIATGSIHPPLSVPLPSAVAQRYYAILLLYREPRYRGRVHAIRAQVWQGSDLVNEIEGEHCIGMTPGDVIHYVEAMLSLLKEVYNIPYFADIEQLDPDYCSIRPCPRHSARFVQLQV